MLRCVIFEYPLRNKTYLLEDATKFLIGANVKEREIVSFVEDNEYVMPYRSQRSVPTSSYWLLMLKECECWEGILSVKEYTSTAP
ncbi:MAG: hypothetical protein QXU54_01480 [Candidatus Micrarchaeia archaeon]